MALVNAAWELVVSCLFQERATETPQHWSGAADIAVSGNIQVYLPEHEGEDGQAQHISSQFHSDTTLWVAPSGDVMGVTGL